MKVVAITGITGQDGSLLAEKFLDRDYKVFGLIRRKADESIGNIKDIVDDVELEYGDVTDAASISRFCKLSKPHVFINCAAQSHVGVSFEQPEYTLQSTGIGVLNCLEAIRQSGLHTKFLQLSSSEMFGNAIENTNNVINENTKLDPVSPYASAKVLGHHLTKNYRNAYRMFASTSIAFNHECPGRRGPNFVTRKIAIGVAKIKSGEATSIRLGNLDSQRDWGHASDYTDAMIKIVEHSEPDDFVLATGETHSVREFCEIAFEYAGLYDYSKYIYYDSSLSRPNELHRLIGDATKARNILKWSPTISFTTLVRQMVDYELGARNCDSLVNTANGGMAILQRQTSISELSR